MANCNSQLAECLLDPSLLTCCSCEEAERLRCIALARLKELTCGCMSSPVQIEDVKYASPVEAMNALRGIIQLTYWICEKSAEMEGPVMETVWGPRCGMPISSTCGTSECDSVAPYVRDGATAEADLPAAPGENC